MVCPLCGLPLDPAIARLSLQLDARTARLLQALHPGWAPASGICPNCALRGITLLRDQRSGASLHTGLELSYPVYAADEADLLPTPVVISPCQLVASARRKCSLTAGSLAVASTCARMRLCGVIKSG